MAELLAAYQSLDSTAPRASVAAALSSITRASPLSWADTPRRELVQLLLDDIGATTTNGHKSRLSSKDLPHALLAVKTLGRHPDASQVIVSEPNLRILHKIASNSPIKYSIEVTNESLRCIANALLLQEEGRGGWLAIKGGDLCVSLLQTCTIEEVFLLSRILFLATARRTPFTKHVVEELRIVDTLTSKFDSCLAALTAGQPFAKEALIDLLKLTFNLVTQYPRMVTDEGEDKPFGELWDDKFDPLINSLLRLLHFLPPTSPSPLQPPLTHVFHVLLNVPVQPAVYTAKWLTPPLSLTTPPSTTSRSSGFGVDNLSRAFSRISSIGSPSSRRSTSSNSAAATAPVSSSSRPITPPPADIVQRLWDLLNDTLTYYIAYDPDDIAVRKKCREEGIVLDELVVSVPIVIAHLAKGDEGSRARFKEFLIPANLDRSQALEKRTDTLGRCIRLMSSVHHPHLKDSIGNMVFALCNDDASTLAAQIGYGNAAGFLFSKGIMAPPAAMTDAAGTQLNPITGTTAPLRSRADAEAEMTEEEREREAERLFVLFDRLERTGMGVNPIRQAQQEGRFENMD